MKKKTDMFCWLKAEKGSVILEFCLMMPIWFLIFGGTYLLFDVSMGMLHLQESNRNLAWLQDDRYDSQGLINQALYDSAVEFFEIRNALERGISNEPMWSFGEEYEKYSSKRGTKNAEIPKFWGAKLNSYKDHDMELQVNNNWAEALSSITGGLLQGKLENGFMHLYSGNMTLKMDKVSAMYLGAVGVSSAILPSPNSSKPLYRSSFIFTRAREDKKDGESVSRKANGEMLLMRRRNVDRNKIRTVNHLFFDNTINRSWPSNGSLGDAQLFMGI